MKKKRDTKKAKKSSVTLSREDQLELQMILDRLSVQNPDGESFHNYLESLAGILGNREEFTLAFLEDLSRKPTVAGFKVFQKLKDIVRGSDNKRAVRQAAYRFEQKGFTVDEGSEAREKVVLVSKEERKAAAHLISMGGTFGFVAAIVPIEGYPVPMALTVYAHVASEAIKASVTQSSHSVYRDYLRMVAGEVPGSNICEVPISHAARLVFELPDLLGRHGYVVELERAKELLKPYHDPQKPPHIHVLMEKIEHPGEAIRAVRIRELMEHLDLSWLLFSQEELAPYRDDLESSRSTVLVLSTDIMQDRTQALLKRAADSLCVGNKKHFYIRFFEEQALVFYLSGMMNAAKDAWITAQHLASDLPPGENPVVVQVILSSIHEHWPEASEVAQEEPEPYETTDSGLLILR